MKQVHCCSGAEDKNVKPWALSFLSSLKNKLGRKHLRNVSLLMPACRRRERRRVPAAERQRQLRRPFYVKIMRDYYISGFY